MEPFTCSHFAHGPDTRRPKRHGDPNLLVAGDVRTIQESIFTPIYDILKNPISNLPRSLHSLAEQSSASITSLLLDATSRRRPCIVLEEGVIKPDGTATVGICLTTTFNKDSIAAMPRIFQHFCVPISPHNLVANGRYREPHVHSMPYEWPRNNGWVIAWCLQSTRKIEEPWVEKVNGKRQIGGPEWFFGRQAVALLLDECTRRRDDWYDTCKNPGLACALAKEVYVSDVSSF